MRTKAQRKAFEATVEGARLSLWWALLGASKDREGLDFNKGRLRRGLAATRLHAYEGNRLIKFERSLAVGWLDANDRAAREIACRAIAEHLATATKPEGVA